MSKLKTERAVLILVMAALLAFGGIYFLTTGFANNNEITPTEDTQPIVIGNAQEIYIKALSNGTYDKSEIRVKKGIPVNLHFSAEPNAGCGRFLSVYGLNVNALS